MTATVRAKKRIGEEVKDIVRGEGQGILDLVNHWKDFSSYLE